MKRRMMAPLAALATAIVAAVLAAACGPGPIRTAPTSTPKPGVTPSPTAPAGVFVPTFTVQPCDYVLPDGQKPNTDVTCGTLTVLERRDGTSDRKLKLAVAILRATGDRRDDPIIYLAGGPGGPALDNDLQAFSKDFAAPLQATRDIVFLDQRGVGRSKPSLTCWEFDRIYFALNRQDDPSADAVQKCRDRLTAEDVALDYYNSVENARDIVDLADALRIDTYNLYGVSYGTRLALTAMRDAPQRIRSVVLDSAFPPPANFYLDRAPNVEAALNGLFDVCAASPACAAHAPNLRATFIDLLNRWNAQPQMVTVQDYGTGQYYQVPVDGNALLEVMFQSFYGQYAIPLLPSAIASAAQGDTRLVSLLASGASEAHESHALGMYLSVQCREEGPFNPVERVAQARTAGFAALSEFGRVDAQYFAEECARWAVAPAPPLENEPVRSDIPTLVLAGTLDAVTPPSYGRIAAGTLTHSTFVEFPGFGHAVLDPGCPMDIVAAFFDNPAAPVDTSCLATLPPIDFRSLP
jgi:pimeloyl-ACP methyl ester carboxylesterase